METDVEFVSADDTVEQAARKMADLDIGALPVCNPEKRLEGMITDRDIAVRVVAAGRDPKSTKVRDLADQPEVVTIGADDSIDEALATMKDKKVRRLPVIDGTQVVGMISQGDLAVNISESKVGDLVEAISAAP
ncbi:MAG: CBS domain-containing protein [Acidimicrobiia bacterium]|nr:CBS domain-containing protein [Acidimicrobiia bacterium]MBV8983284.1 CBS domain-containing protein [Acidimicrobiia bacterium]MBV9041550.1 CBS domain-containing protein [Acidimicrobiia bacterium]MBV9283604.1 CBS domain-containing protein [Acidimicrobiia bacterium]